MKNFKKKTLISAISIATLSTISTVSHTSDVDIYQAAQQGAPSILLMLDTSGSMGISSLVLPKDNAYGSPGDVTSSICASELVPEGATGNYMRMPEWQYDARDYRTNVTVNGVANQRSPTYGKTSFYNEVKIGDKFIPYYTRGCTIDDNQGSTDLTNVQFDRLSKLKEAILTLLASNEIQDTVKMGLANFSARTDVNIFDFGLKLVDGHSGAILVPVAELTTAQRQKIAEKLAEFKSLDTTTNELGNTVTRVVNNRTISQLSLTNNVFDPEVLTYKRVSSGTPTAHAYAEAAAYMMGTNTGTRSTWNYWSDRITKSVQYVYDGYAIMRNDNALGVSASELQGYDKKTVYFLCVQAWRKADGTLNNGTTKGWDYSADSRYNNRITQCVNRWQGWKGENDTSISARVRTVTNAVSPRISSINISAIRPVADTNTTSFINNITAARTFYGLTSFSRISMRDESIVVYSGDNSGAARSGHFVYDGSTLIGEVQQVSIGGTMYEYFVDFRTSNKRTVRYATVNVGSNVYYVYQTTSDWSNRRDDNLFLYNQTSNFSRDVADAEFVNGYPERNGKGLQGIQSATYRFLGLNIIKSGSTTAEIFYSPSTTDRNKIYTNLADARWQAWKAYVDMPEGSRMVDENGDGGWMRLSHEPMDIEPIVGANHPNGETGAIGLFVYRANPFSLSGGDAGTGRVSSLTADDMVGGMAYSAAETMNANKTQYIRGGSTNACNGNGIYFLTDGAPNSTQDEMARTIMNHSLTTTHAINTKPTDGLTSPALKANLFAGETGGWEYIGEYAKRLNDPTKNPARMTIKTAVVGFGSSFESASSGQCDSVTNLDAKNACLWGSEQYGKGGFYYANNADDIKNSIKKFVADVNVNIEPVSTGSPSIPTNTFNPTEAPTEAYYGSFTPKPNAATQIWLGDMNKYKLNSDRDLVGQNDIKLFKTDGTLNAAATGLWTNGSVLAQLPLQKDPDDATKFARKVYTDRVITGLINKTAQNSSALELQQVDAASLYNDGALSSDPNKNYWLNILGYDLDVNGATPSLDNLPTTVLRQLGAVMHSSPVLLTQEGQLEAVREIVDGEYTGKRIIQSTGRKDFLMFGSTQGLLHIVDARTGKEKLAFVPNEMMRVQKEALLNENKSTGGINRLFYGVDAPWTVYSQYVLKTDSSSSSQTGSTTSANTSGVATANGSNSDTGSILTVNSASNRYNESNADSLNGAGVQWVYGGLRMGGRSYYALDLTNLDEPKLRFHIDPENSKVYANGREKTYSELAFMGQSWSKPTITRVKWKGETKLVMFVGGGYDAGGTNGNGEFDNNGVRTGYAGYESPNYDQTNKRGAGVYMFDATNGDLLWWGGANVNSTTAENSNSDLAQTRNDDLQYSVVSQINAIDRNNDGLTDHLYFGDLGGQGFRIDIDNTATNSGGFVKRIERLFTEHTVNGASPRFYEMPSVSAYNYEGVIRVLAAFNSGNRSSPLAGTNQTTDNTTVTTTSAVDAVYTVYDYNVVSNDLYTVTDAVYNTWSKPTTFEPLDQERGTSFNRETTRGWKYVYDTTAGKIKGLGDISTLGYFLYTNGYDKDGNANTQANQCSATVVGATTPYKFCLPTGKCDLDFHGYTRTGELANRPVTGSSQPGITTPGFGGGMEDKSKVGITGQGPVDCTVTPEHISCKTVDLGGSVKQLRWYEAN